MCSGDNLGRRQSRLCVRGVKRLLRTEEIKRVGTLFRVSISMLVIFSCEFFKRTP